MNLGHRIISAAAMLLITVMPALSTAEPMGGSGLAKAQEPKAAEHRPVLLISIDGLSPDTLTSSAHADLNIPVLRGLMQEGSYADRVINVNPTVTNPNHTSLVTGVSPARHGVFNNRPFSPTAKLPGSYSQYKSIKAPTLWYAAKEGGLGTASLYWPVTRESDDIDVNIISGNSKDDEQITNDAVRIIAKHRPHLMTVHYVSYDSTQHEYGRGSPEGFESLERIDDQIGKLLSAFRAENARGVIAIASDHGFDRTIREVNLNVAFADAGFITFTDETRSEVRSWRAFAWYVGASAMVVLNDPSDPALDAEVGDFLRMLAQRPDSGIEDILSPEILAQSGLSDQARFVIALKPGYRMGNAMKGPFSTAYAGGSHGAFTTASTRQDMHSAFIIAGEGIGANKNLGTIDIRQIAPTLAKLLNVPFTTAQAEALLVTE